ncbi:unnamed protein product, partial [Gongylonema pulchrum]|uniref:WH2 domain-containing protein n=1 Tax=Gongylonema pulchrum TaxID=637853 RepID=A0A183EYW9_9BILA
MEPAAGTFHTVVAETEKSTTAAGIITSDEGREIADPLKSTIAKEGSKHSVATVAVFQTARASAGVTAGTAAPELPTSAKEVGVLHTDNGISLAAEKRKPFVEVAPAISPDLVALADSFEELDSTAQLRDVTALQRPIAHKAKGSRSLVKNLSRISLADDFKTKLTANKPALVERRNE